MKKENLTGLIARCLTGETTAQEELVLAVQDRVYYHCRKMLKDEDRALDLTQDVLMVMLTKLDTLQNPEAFSSWLGGITANLCRNAINRGPREVQIPEDEDGNSLLDTYETLDQQSVPDKVLDNDETRRMIAELVDDLPDAQRQCVLLYYYDEMSVKDIAAALAVSENTIKSRLNYARKSIKEGVERYEKQGVKLYGLSPLPFLLFFLGRDAKACCMTGEQAAQLTQQVMRNVSAATGAGVSAISTQAGIATTAKAATAVGKGVLGLSTKAIASVAAGLVLVGCITGGILLGMEENNTGEITDTSHSSVSGESQYQAPADSNQSYSDADGDFNEDNTATPTWTDEPVDQGGSADPESEDAVSPENGENTLQEDETSENPQNPEEPAEQEDDSASDVLSVDDILVDFEGAAIELSEPFRLYSLMWTTTVDSYHAIASDAEFTVTNNGKNKNTYIRINIIEYIRSAESFESEVVHDGEHMWMDMLGEYWNENDDALWLCGGQVADLSAGDGLSWAGSDPDGEIPAVVKLLPGESVTFHLPERTQDTAYLLVVRYLDGTGNYDLPIRRFYVTADDIRNPLRKESTNEREQGNSDGNESEEDFAENSQPITEQITRSEEDVYRFISNFVANYKNTESYRNLEGEGIEFLEDCLNLLRTDPASDEDIASYMEKYQRGSYDDEMFAFMLECWIEFGGPFGEGCIITVQ